MDHDEIPPEYKDKYQVYFVTMFWPGTPDEIYDEWTEGRIDIRTYGDQHSNNEIHYSTRKTPEWFAFQNKFSGKWLTNEELESFKKEVAGKFRRTPSNP